MYYRLVIPEGDETESVVDEFRKAFVSHIKDVDGLPDNEILFEKNRYTEGRSIKFAKKYDCLIDEVNVDKQTGTPTTVSLVYSPNPQEEYVDQPVDDVVDSLSSGLDDDSDSTDDVAGSNDATDISLSIADDDSVEDEPTIVPSDDDAVQTVENNGSEDIVDGDGEPLDDVVATEDFSNAFVKTDDNSTDNVGSFNYIESPVNSENGVSEDDPLSDILPSVEDLREEVSTPLNLGDTLNDPYLKMSKDMLDAQLSMERAQVRFAVNSLTKSDVNRLMEEIRERASHDKVLSKYVQAALDKAQSDRDYEQRRNAVANAYSIALEHYVASKIEEIKATYRAEHPDDTDERIAQFESENYEQRNKEEKSFFDARLDAQNRVVEITSEGENNSVISKVLSFVLLKRSFKSLFNNAREEVRVAQNAKNQSNDVVAEYEPAHYAQQAEDSFAYDDDDSSDDLNDSVYDNSDVDDEPAENDSYDDAFNAGYQKALEDILARQEENDSVEDDADDVVDEPADGDPYELTDEDLFDDDVDDEPADTSNEVVDEGDGNEDFEPKTDVEADEPEDEDSTKDSDSEGEETSEDQTPEVQDGGEPVEESLSETEDNDSEVATNDDDDSDDADDFDFVDEPADDDAESDSSVTTTLDPVPEVQKDEDSEKHDEPVVETPSTPEVVSPVDTATKKPKKNHHKILQRVGIGVAAVALAAGLYIGVGGMVFHLPPFQQTQQEAPVTDNQNIMDQIHDKFKAGQTVTITDNGQQKKATVTDVTTNGVNVKDDAGNQYTLSPQLAQAYVNAHPEQFKTDGGAQNTSDATTQH